jgi:hypothetical protein
MAYTDTMGYVVSTTSSEALAAYEQGVSLWLRQRSGLLRPDHAAVIRIFLRCTRAYEPGARSKRLGRPSTGYGTSGRRP